MNSESDEQIKQIVENLMRIHPLLTKNLNRSIRSKTNLNPGSLFILGLLKRAGMLTMSEIGCKLSMPKPHVTAQIDRLIAEGMVERMFDPNDRRTINIQLTDKGQTDFTQIKLDVSEEIRSKLQSIDANKIQELLDASNKVKEILTEVMIDNNNCVK
jgi:DNA-binding MarR family transcriptional regulator